MSISINQSKCIACGKCVEACPGNLIKLRPAEGAVLTAAAERAGKTAVIKRVRDCWGCTSCIKECPVSAIDFFLGADMGGKGSMLNVTEEADVYRWKITSPEGHVREIVINRKDSNKY